MLSCPNGTTIEKNTNVCLGCQKGCRKCRNEDKRICLVCEEGLVLHNDKCYDKCPFGWVSSLSVPVICLEYVDPLNAYMFFPLIEIAFISTAINIVSFFVTKRKTLVGQCTLASLSIVINFSLFLEMFLALQVGNYEIFTNCMLFLLGQLALNFLFLITLHFTVDDYQFNQYKEENP